MKGVITGIGWMTASGAGRGRTEATLAMPPGELPEIDRGAVFEKPDRRFGRMDPFSRLGLAAIAFALKDAGLDRWERKRPVGLVASTTYGCLATDGSYFDTALPQAGALASPHLFAYTLPNTFLGEAAIRFGLTGSAFVVNDPSPSGLTPLRMALESLCWGEEEAVVAGTCDLPRPADLPGPGEEKAGALFAVLETCASGHLPPLGELELDRRGDVLFRGRPATSLPALFRECLEAFHGRGGSQTEPTTPNPGRACP